MERLRPTSVTVFGVLNVIFGGFAMLGIFTTPLLLIVQGDKNAVVRAMHASTVFAIYYWTLFPIGSILGIGLLLSGIGLFQLKPLARKFCIFYAVVSAALMPLHFFFGVSHLLPEQLKDLEPIMGPFANVFMVFAAIAGACIRLALLALLVFFMTRPKVKAAFAPEEPQTLEPQPQA